MEKSKKLFFIALVLTALFAVGMALLGDALEKRKDEVSDILVPPLKKVMKQDDSLFCGIVLVKRTGAHGEPRSVSLSKWERTGEILYNFGYVDRSTVLPGRIMQIAVGTFLVDRNYLLPQDLDSMGTRKGFRFERINRDRFWLWRDYMDRFEDYFGSSEACYLPNVKYHFDEVRKEMASGQGMLLSPEQILTFWDVLCNGGVRPGTRFTRRHRVLREITAREVADRFKMDMEIPIIGQSSSGTLPFGFVPGVGSVNDYPHTVQSATFVGGFPADNPMYTMCVCLFSNDGTPRADLSQELFGELAKLVLENEGLWK